MAGETLRVVIGAAAGTEIPLGDEFTLGRTETAEGNLGGDPELSRRHATVRRRPDGGLEIEDHNSTNGTHVNGVRITAPHALSAGDTIRVGQTTINVHAEAPATGPGAGATVIGAAPQMPPGGPEATPPPPPPPPPFEPPPPAPEPPAFEPAPEAPAPETPAFGEPAALEPPAPETPAFGEPAASEPPAFSEPPAPEPPAPEPPSFGESLPPEPPASEPTAFGDPEPEDEGKGPSVPEPMESGDPLAPASPEPTPAQPFEPHGDPLRDDATQIDQPSFQPPDDVTRFDAPPPATPPTEGYPAPPPPAPAPAYEQQPQQGYDPYQQQYAQPQAGYPEQYAQQAAPAGAPADGLALKRPIGRVIVLALLTFGIYAYYWFWITIEQFNRETGKNVQPVMILIPIYNIIILYNLYQDVSYARQRIGQTPLGTGEIILALLFWPYGVYLVNQYWDARTQGQATNAPIAGGERIIIIVGIIFWVLVCLLPCLLIVVAGGSS